MAPLLRRSVLATLLLPGCYDGADAQADTETLDPSAASQGPGGGANPGSGGTTSSGSSDTTPDSGPATSAPPPGTGNPTTDPGNPTTDPGNPTTDPGNPTTDPGNPTTDPTDSNDPTEDSMGESSSSTSEGDDDPATTDTPPPGDDDFPPIQNGCSGYATRYWDCCKAHCGWQGNVPAGVQPLTSCNQNDDPQPGSYNQASSCEQPTANAAYTCHDLSPWQVTPQLAFGFAAVPSNGDICGRCYQLDFDGSSHNGGSDPGSSALAGKTMVVQATNIGFDVGGGQFDLLIPGGGVGLFDACSAQLDVPTSALGQTYGGLLAQCKQQLGFNASLNAYKSCVTDACSTVFSGHDDLLDGCDWFVNWFEVADNPNLQYQEVECPAGLINASGMDRSALDDVSNSCG